MLRVLVWAILAFCVICLAYSSAIHLLTFFNSKLGGPFGYLWLQFGVIGAWVVTVLIYKIKGEQLGTGGLPDLSRLPLYCLFGYFIFNMIYLFVGLRGGSAEVVNGSYQLMDHNKLIRYLSEEEYYRDMSIELASSPADG
jgi:hypothetical protein